MVVLFVNRFRKDLKSVPQNVRKKVFDVIQKLEAAESLENPDSIVAKWKDKRATNIITGFVLVTGG